MRDVGYVTRGRHEGKDVVGIRAVLGQALHHAGPEGDAGRPRLPPVRSREHPGPRRGHRHHRGADPGRPSRRQHRPPPSAFGRRVPERARTGASDVFIPMDWVIGGEKMVGQGWRMLMECLAAGRAISLPSSSAAGAKSLLRNTSRLCPHPQAVRPADRQDGRARGAARAHGRDGLRQRGRARRHGGDGEPRREAVGDLGAS